MQISQPRSASSDRVIYHRECPVCGGETFSPYLSCRDHAISGETFALHRCRNCGMTVTQGVPDEDHIGRYYQSEGYISHSDTREGMVNRLYHLAREVMLQRKRRIVERLLPADARTLLDIGCGTGYFLKHMQDHGWKTLGIEPEARAREYARERFQLQVEPPEKLFTLPEASFYAITLWHVLEHIHRLQDYIRRIGELLKDEGRLFVALPNHTSFDGKYYGEFWAAYDVPRHLWHFSPGAFTALMKKHGFQVVQYRRMPLDGFYVSILSETYRQRSMALFRGGWMGLRSFLRSLRDPNASSSILYILKKGSR